MKSNFTNALSIKAVLYTLCVVIVLVLTTVIGGVFWVTAMKANDSVTINMAGRQRMLSQRMTKELYQYRDEPTEENLSKFQNSVWTFDQTLAALSTGGPAPVDIDRSSKARKAVNKPSPEVVAQLEKVAALWRPMHEQLASFDGDSGRLGALVSLLRKGNTPLLKESHGAVLLIGKEARGRLGLLKAIAFGAAAVGALGIALVLWQTALLNGKIRRVRKAIGEAAAGDFRKLVPVAKGRNEIDIIAQDVNTVISEVRTMAMSLSLQSHSVSASIQELGKATRQLSEDADATETLALSVKAENAGMDDNIHAIGSAAADNAESMNAMVTSFGELSDSTNVIASASEQASTNVSTVASAAEQMTANITNVNSNLHEVNASVSTVASAVEEMTASLNVVRGRCSKVSEEAEKAAGESDVNRGIMDKLYQSAQEIGKVVEVINAIADQTNMLALNAAIEAAGAGEAGKGFAVVANEVKELARQTADATKMISDKVQEMQVSTGEATSASQAIAATIAQINSSTTEIAHAVDEQASTTNEIASSIGNVSHAAGEVTLNAKEMERAAQEVARAVTEAASGTAEIARSTESLAALAAGLMQRSEQVNTVTITVRESVEKAGEASGRVRADMEETSGRVELMNSSIYYTDVLIDVMQKASEMLDKAAMNVKACAEPFDIRAVKAAHLQWLGHLSQVAHGRGSMSEGEVNSGHECAFGKWYDQDGTELFGNHALFKEVGGIHMQLHELGKESIRLTNEGKKDEAKSHIEKMHSLATEMFHNLELLYVDEDVREVVC